MFIGQGITPFKNNGAALTVFNQTTCSYFFDEINNYINYGSVLDSTIEGAGKVFSMRFVLKRLGTGSDFIFSNWTVTSNQKSSTLYFDTTNELYFNMSSNGSSNSGSWISTAQITDTDWHDIILTYNNGVVIVYFDGAVMAGTSTTIPTTLFASSASGLIGAINTGASPYDGYINQMQFTNDVITAQEAVSLYNGGSMRLGSEILDNLVINSIFDNDTWSPSSWDVVNTEGTNGASVNMTAIDRDCNENPY